MATAKKKPKKKTTRDRSKASKSVVVPVEQDIETIQTPPLPFTPEELIEHFSRNLTVCNIAARYKMSERNFMNRINESPAHLEAFDQGQTLLKSNYETTLFKMAMGMPIYSVTKNKDGAETKKVMHPNPTLIMFIGKARFGMRDSSPNINIGAGKLKGGKDGEPQQITFEIGADEVDI